jgi:hypothetical protein
MISCKLGLHEWMYAYEGTLRWCKKCKKKQEMADSQKWVDTDLIKPKEDNTKYCECPRDYTVTLKLQLCPHCGLPRRPHKLPVKSR